MTMYRTNVITNGDGQEVHLPGGSIFVMPHAIEDSIDVRTISTTQQYPIGTKLVDGDSIYRYAEFGGTTKAGDLCSVEAPDAAHDALDPTGAGVGAGIAVGSTIISFADSLTLVLNEYAGGKLITEVGAGLGYTYDILSNTVVSAAVDGLVVIKHGLKIAITSATNVRLQKSRYKEVVIMPTTQLSVPAGVSMGVGADGSFGWLCTRGLVGMFLDGTITVGDGVMVSTGPAGEGVLYDVSGTADFQPFANLNAPAINDSELGTVDLHIE